MTTVRKVLQLRVHFKTICSVTLVNCHMPVNTPTARNDSPRSVWWLHIIPLYILTIASQRLISIEVASEQSHNKTMLCINAHTRNVVRHFQTSLNYAPTLLFTIPEWLPKMLSFWIVCTESWIALKLQIKVSKSRYTILKYLSCSFMRRIFNWSLWWHIADHISCRLSNR